MRLVASISVSLLCVKERKTQILCPLAPCVNVYPSNLPGTMCERGLGEGQMVLSHLSAVLSVFFQLIILWERQEVMYSIWQKDWHN